VFSVRKGIIWLFIATIVEVPAIVRLTIFLAPLRSHISLREVFLSLGLNGNVLSPGLVSIEHRYLKISGPLSIVSCFCYDCCRFLVSYTYL
jgi:hypothetical protein